METPEFNLILERRITLTKEVLITKAQEYAKGNNRLHNFDVTARINDETPSRSLWGMAQKHLVSVMDLVNSDEIVPVGLIEEKIGDLINYLILLEAILKRDRTEI